MTPPSSRSNFSSATSDRRGHVLALINDEQAEKIVDINHQLQQFLGSSLSKKILLAEPMLEPCLRRMMNPHYRGMSYTSAQNELPDKSPFIFYPLLHSSDYQEHPLGEGSRLKPSGKKNFENSARFLQIDHEVDKFIKRGTEVIEQIKRGAQCEFLVKRKPHLMKQGKLIDLKALLDSLNKWSATEQFFLLELIPVCLKTIITRLSSMERTPFNNELDSVLSPISLGVPEEPVRLPHDKYFYDQSEAEYYIRKKLNNPFTGAPVSCYQPAKSEYYQAIIAALQEVIKNKACAEQIVRQEAVLQTMVKNKECVEQIVRQEAVLQTMVKNKECVEQVIREEFGNLWQAQDSYFKDANAAIKEITQILKGTPLGEISLPIKNQNIHETIGYMSEVLASKEVSKDKFFEVSPLFIQLVKQIDQAYESFPSKRVIAKRPGFFNSLFQRPRQSFRAFSENIPEQRFF